MGELGRHTNMSIRGRHMQDAIARLRVLGDAHDFSNVAFLARDKLLKLGLELVELVDAGEVDEVVDLFFVEVWGHNCGSKCMCGQRDDGRRRQ